jgi:hypothetical protein
VNRLSNLVARLVSSSKFGPILIVATVVAMAAWTWDTWPDVLVDFGQQMYLSWRIAEGQVLYRDLAYYNGPLSLYINALLFRVFGVSLRVLVVTNFALLCVLLCVLYQIGIAVGSRRSATVACIWFSTLFAFGQFVGIGNYNYICPYTHEVTHGLLLCLLALLWCWRAHSNKARYALVSGFALGLAFLTKAEVFQAGAAGVLVHLCGTIAIGGVCRRTALTRMVLLLASFLVAPAVAVIALASAMSLEQAMVGTLGSWVGTFTRQLVSGPYFQWCMGIDDARNSLILIAKWLGWYACLILTPLVFSSLRPQRNRLIRFMTIVTIFFVEILVVLTNPLQLDWLDALRPLPVLLLVAGILPVASLRCLSRAVTQEANQQRSRSFRQLSLIVCGFFLMGKMILYARIWHYGFVLAAPGSFVLVIALTEWFPERLARAGLWGDVVHAAALAMILALCVSYLHIEQGWLARKIYRVGLGADAFWADERGKYVNAALGELAHRSSEHDTLVSLPEGIMLNYLLRRRNPTPFTIVQTTEIILYGENRILTGFRSHPPEWIAVVHKDTDEFGVRFFGRDYARRLGRWVRENYHSEVCIGALPLKSDAFGILLLRRIHQSKQPTPSKSFRR